MTTPKKAGEAAGAGFGLPSFDDLSKLVEQFKLPGVDTGALMEWQRKDMEALAEANRQALEGIQALAARRGEMLQQTLAQWQEALKDVAGGDALGKQSEAMKLGMQRAIDNFRELAEMEAQTRTKAWSVLQERMQENLANLQKLLQPK